MVRRDPAHSGETLYKVRLFMPWGCYVAGEIAVVRKSVGEILCQGGDGADPVGEKVLTASGRWETARPWTSKPGFRQRSVEKGGPKRKAPRRKTTRKRAQPKRTSKPVEVV